MSQKVALSFQEICSALENYDLPDTDIVIGIGRGGTVPACLVASKLGCDLLIVRVNYRDDDNKPVRIEPVFLEDLTFSFPPKTKVLLVDDVSVTGKTLEVVKARLNPFPVQTFVLKGRADHVLYPEIKVCVRWPWHETIAQAV